MTEQTIRKNGKWAKVTGRRGSWACAKGWSGECAARALLTYPTKDGALVAARYWVSE